MKEFLQFGRAKQATKTKHADSYLVNALSTLTAFFFILSASGLRCGATPGPIEAPSLDLRYV
jgi:hypothetical protein